MWERFEIKEKAKKLLHANYWKCVGATLIFSILTYASTSSGRDDNNGTTFNLNNFSIQQIRNIFIIGFSVLIVVAIVSTIIKILIKNPVKVGYSKFLLSLEENPDVSISYVFTSLKGIYVKSGIQMLTTDLIIFLYALLLIIPGIIKAFEYRMVPFILAENSDLTAKEARELSKKIMYGNKWKAFVLDLSFFGWELLNGLTWGLLGIFYVNPYKQLTEMNLYKAIK